MSTEGGKSLKDEHAVGDAKPPHVKRWTMQAFNMKLPSEAQILSALEASGYLFEQDVATKLSDLGFHVETSYAFQDQELEKSREIDVRAIRQVAVNEAAKLQFFVELLVECKDFDSPLVFLERSKNARELNPMEPKEYIFPFRVMQKRIDAKSFQEVPAFAHLQLRDHHYYMREQKQATQFSKIVRKGSDWVANHEGIYDSLVLPLAKLLEVRRADVLPRARGRDWRAVWLFFPMVVLRDHLYALDVSSPARTLEQRGRISFVRNLDTDKLQGHYLLDFVTFSALDDFITREVHEFCAPIKRLVENDPKALENISGGAV